MVLIVGVRFKGMGKVYYFDPGDKVYSANQDVIVETARGIEYGTVVIANKHISEDDIVPPLKPVIRAATEQDTLKLKENKEKEKSAFLICQEKITKHKLDMKLIDVEYTFDCGKVLFYFTADARVDFRELVKDLAAVFKTRIELRQIGVRDEAKMLGGMGICGRPLCCSGFLSEFAPVSIKMAKEQGISLNPAKISGVCSRLMCCLKYENDVYEELSVKLPRVGAIVKTPDGNGTVISVAILKNRLRVRLDNDTCKDYGADDISIIKNVFVDVEITPDLKTLED